MIDPIVKVPWFGVMRWRRVFVTGIWTGVMLAAAGCAGVSTERAPTLVNLSAAKAAVVAYYDSGEYTAALSAVAREAEAWVRERAASRMEGERLAIIFDVDETVLSNYPHMLSRDFGYVPDEFTGWVERGEAPALIPVRRVYQTALAEEVTVFFLTGRRDPAERAGTVENLAREGMGAYERLIMREANEPGDTAAVRKALRRSALEAEGYTIIASIGDQHSDLSGGHAERVFKLPNPFYEIP